MKKLLLLLFILFLSMAAYGADSAITSIIADDDDGVNEAYGAGWDADIESPEKDDVYDYLHLLDTDDDGDIDVIDSTIADDDDGVDGVYGAGWDTDTDSPEKDDVYDYLHTIDTDDDGDVDNIDATALAAAETDPNVDTAAEIVAIIDNTAIDLGTGVLTAAGFTVAANENITLGAQTLDHNGTDFVFNDEVTVPDDAYAAGWDGDLGVPTKNAVYDQVSSAGGGDLVLISATTGTGDPGEITIARDTEYLVTWEFKANTANHSQIYLRFGTAGSIQSGATDYAFNFRVAGLETTPGEVWIGDDAHTAITLHTTAMDRINENGFMKGSMRVNTSTVGSDTINVHGDFIYTNTASGLEAVTFYGVMRDGTAATRFQFIEENGDDMIYAIRVYEYSQS